MIGLILDLNQFGLVSMDEFEMTDINGGSLPDLAKVAVEVVKTTIVTVANFAQGFVAGFESAF